LRFFLFFLTWAIGVLASQPQLEKLVPLNRAEGYTPQVFHNRYLWLGRWKTGEDGIDHHFLEIRDHDGSHRLDSVEPKHSVQYLFPFDKERILFTGKHYTSKGWRSYYSLASFIKGKIRIETHQLPSQFQVEEFAGDPKRLIFNLVSDRTLVAVSADGIRQLPLMISGPGMMAQFGDSLFVLERRSRVPGDEDVVRVDLKTLKVQRVFSSNRNGLLSLVALNDGKTLATSESLAHQVLLIDSQTNLLKSTISLPNSNPNSLAPLGHCLVVGSYAPAVLTLIDLESPEPQVIDRFSLENHKEDLPKVAKISVNPSTGALFLRSIGFLQEDPKTTNSVYRYLNPAWVEKCKYLPPLSGPDGCKGGKNS